MRTHLFSFFFFLSLSNCFDHDLSACSLQSPEPIYLPIKNTTVSNQIKRRGIPLSVGTPEQTLVFFADSEVNHTYMWNSPGPPDCGTLLACSFETGGFFDKEKSSSWWQDSSFDPLQNTDDFDTGRFDKYKSLLGTDIIRINSSLTLSSFPIGIETKAEIGRRNSLGLARNSTFLNRLFSAGLINSRTWGYHAGWTGAETQHQLDGSLVLGGYDEAKIVGQNSTFSVSNVPDCPSGLLVTLRDVELNLLDGRNLSLFGPSAGSAMNACLGPSCYLMNLPVELWESFVQFSKMNVLGRSIGINEWAMLISSNSSYNGDLTMTLSSGLQIRIPNHQLVLPDYHTSPEGELLVNGSDRVVLINSLQQINKNDMPILGLPFFSSAYLFVNEDMAQFTLWKSNPTTDTNLVAIGQTCQNDTSFSPLPTPSWLPNSKPTNQNRRINKGTITGIVIGAITGIALFCGAMIQLKIQKRKRMSQSLQAQNDSADNQSRQIQESGHGALFIKAELPSDRQPPQEMPLTQNPPFTLSPFELPGSQHHPPYYNPSPYELPGSQS